MWKALTMSQKDPNFEEIVVDPFGRLTCDSFSWYGTLTLPAWSPFRFRPDYRGGTVPGVEAGKFMLSVTYPNSREKPDLGDVPSRAQVRAFEYTIEHQGPMQDAMIGFLLAAYPEWFDVYHDAGVPETSKMPSVLDLSTCHSLVGPGSITLHAIGDEGLAYVGYDFQCSWEEEYGFKFITLGSQIVDAGLSYILPSKGSTGWDQRRAQWSFFS
jgi:hypothetical protein